MYKCSFYLPQLSKNFYISLFRLEENDEAIPVREVADNVLDLEESSDSGEDDDDERRDRRDTDTERDFVNEKKAICFEEELIMLANMKYVSACNRKGCVGDVSIKAQTKGTSIRLSWVRKLLYVFLLLEEYFMQEPC